MSFKNNPAFRLENNGSRARLVEPLWYSGRGVRVIVPVFSSTDFASVPRLLLPLFPTLGPYALPALLHDSLYASGVVSRARADGIFLAAMKEKRVGIVQRWAIYAAVRAFGWVAWNQHRRKKAP